MSTEPPFLRRGEEIVPGYRVLGHLSRAQVLDVYDVWSEQRDCSCIAKTLRPDRLADRTARRRLAREGRLLERLTHPNLVRGYGTVLGRRPTVIMETLPGETLAHMIAASPRGRLSAGDVCHLGMQLCSAVGYLHREGVLHLDLKPSNIIATAGQARVIDLSLARAPGRVPRGVGTRQYLSPEQARGGVAGAPADVWGIGAVLYAAVTGTRPFGARDDRRYDQLERRAAPVSSIRRTSRAVAAAVDACLEVRPADRPAVRELSAALAAAAA